MKKKNDDLLRLAFGELPADAAHDVEARVAADPSAQKDLEAFRELRSALQQLPPPPPDGLTADRLRAAILDRELSARRPSFNWSWAPLALASLAAVLFIARPAHRSEPQLLTLDDHPSGESLKARAFAPLGKFPAPAASEAVSLPTEKPSVATLPVVHHRHHSASTKYSTTDGPRISFGPGPFMLGSDDFKSKGMTLASYHPETIDSPRSTIYAMDTANHPTTENADTVVIVSSKRDLDTGAAAASETEATHVLVGG